MNKILLFILSLLTVVCFSQESDSTASPMDTVQFKVLDETNEIIILTEEFIIEPNDSDTSNFAIGGRNIRIIEKDDDTEVTIKKKNTLDDDDGVTFLSPNYNDKFRGHWAGLEFGLNNYVDANFSISRNPTTEFMELNTGKSWNFNLNFAQYSVGFNSKKVGLITGLGLEWSNYHFSNNNTIQKHDGNIVSLDLDFTPTKNRFQTGYLTVPLLFEVQLTNEKRSHRPHLSVGMIGGIKLFSNTKIYYIDNGNTRKVKNKDDYYLSPLRYGLTARAGIRMVKVYFNYYLTPLFISGKNPELYPLSFGFALSF